MTSLELREKEYEVKLMDIKRLRDVLFKENQLNDLCLVAEKLGLIYASHFIKNYYKFKIKK